MLLQAALVIRGFDYLQFKKSLKTANAEGKKLFLALLISA